MAARISMRLRTSTRFAGNELGGAVIHGPAAREVATDAETVHRRMLLKPGITGLCQVSGRWDLPWAEARLSDRENPLTRSIIGFFSLREVVLWDVRLAQAA
jgi:hypothetical protein